jgi:hypothetical protein
MFAMDKLGKRIFKSYFSSYTSYTKATLPKKHNILSRFNNLISSAQPMTYRGREGI